MTTLNLDRPATKFISPNTEVWTRYAIELGHNGKQGDESQTLMIAPDVDNPYSLKSEWVYIETNGDPVEVGYVESNYTESPGSINFSDEGLSLLGGILAGDNGPDESHPSYWIFEALLSHGFEL